MISSDQSNSVLVPNFQSQQKQKRFYAVETSVHEVPHEDVVRFRTISAHFEQLHQIVKLTVNVTANSNRRLDVLNVALLQQDVAGHVAQISDFRFFDAFALLEQLNLTV